jgi:hypothetical protein
MKAIFADLATVGGNGSRTAKICTYNNCAGVHKFNRSRASIVLPSLLRRTHAIDLLMFYRISVPYVNVKIAYARFYEKLILEGWQGNHIHL